MICPQDDQPCTFDHSQECYRICRARATPAICRCGCNCYYCTRGHNNPTGLFMYGHASYCRTRIK